jgi:hypothetical protein
VAGIHQRGELTVIYFQLLANGTQGASSGGVEDKTMKSKLLALFLLAASSTLSGAVVVRVGGGFGYVRPAVVVPAYPYVAPVYPYVAPAPVYTYPAPYAVYPYAVGPAYYGYRGGYGFGYRGYVGGRGYGYGRGRR